MQFTSKRHYLLTVLFQDPPGGERTLVFELDTAAVHPLLARLEARSGKAIEFTDAVACTEYKTADDCGVGSPAELRNLTRVFVDAPLEGARKTISTAIAAANLGLVVVDAAPGAEIVLKFTSGVVLQPSYAIPSMGSGMWDAGRGEVWVVRDGRSRVVMTFENVQSSRLQKEPVTKFVRSFLDAYRSAGTARR